MSFVGPLGNRRPISTDHFAHSRNSEKCLLEISFNGADVRETYHSISFQPPQFHNMPIGIEGDLRISRKIGSATVFMVRPEKRAIPWKLKQNVDASRSCRK